MKILLTSLNILIGMGINTVSVQINYYTETKTFHETGHTYQCDAPPHKLVTLYNIENTFTYEDLVYKETGEVYDGLVSQPRLDVFEEDTWTRNKCRSIVNQAFTEEERKRVDGGRLVTTMIISPEIGRVIEVYFTFVNFGPLISIPVSTFRTIEVKLKENIWFTIKEDGKKLNYLMIIWPQKIIMGT